MGVDGQRYMNARPRVLIIDDDATFRSLIVSILRRDFIVSVAADGYEGFCKAREHTPDVAVIDVQMPRWDGIETLKAFRSHASLEHVKIIMMTGDASKETVITSVRCGANDYMIKSNFNKRDIIDKIKRLVSAAWSARIKNTELTGRNTYPQHATSEGQLPPVAGSSQSEPVPWTQSLSDIRDDDERLQRILDSWD